MPKTNVNAKSGIWAQKWPKSQYKGTKSLYKGSEKVLKGTDSGTTVVPSFKTPLGSYVIWPWAQNNPKRSKEQTNLLPTVRGALGGSPSREQSGRGLLGGVHPAARRTQKGPECFTLRIRPLGLPNLVESSDSKQNKITRIKRTEYTTCTEGRVT